MMKGLSALTFAFTVVCSSLTVGADIYEYDALNRLTKVIYEDGSYVEYEYDANGNIVSTNVYDATPEDGDDGKESEDTGDGPDDGGSESEDTGDGSDDGGSESEDTGDGSGDGKDDPEESGASEDEPEEENNIITSIVSTMQNIITTIVKWFKNLFR